MSTTPLIPLSEVFAPGSSNSSPDSKWEYLDNTIRPHTIDLVLQYRKLCLMAVNNNIIKFHQDTVLLNHCLENLLSIIESADKAIAHVSAKHAGRVGDAMAAGTIAEFLSIHEEYVMIQTMMFNANNAFFVPLDRLVTEASQRALNARQSEGNK